METAVLEDIIFRKNQKLLYVFDFFNDRSLFVEYTGESKEIDYREYPVCTNSKSVPPKQVVFGSSSRKLYNNIVVSDDEEEEDEPEVDELFLNGEDEESLPDFDNIENMTEEDE
jgi:glycosylphosphatidylinositol transamidase (GPIT) subunit GPI8